jgi:hypothetical protein
VPSSRQASAAVTILVPTGSVWKYLDNGTNQGTAWRAAGFADGAWASGAAQLGYGDGDEATVVSFGPNSGAKYITTYFRRAFTIVNPSAFAGLTLRLLRDDGAVVYLNGTEVFRSNMPTGSIGYTTRASSALGAPAESTFVTASVPISALVAGTNVLAVEVHQANGTSSDLSFDLELSGSTGASVTRGPYLQTGTPTSAVVRWRTDVATGTRVRYGLAPESLTGIADGAAGVTEHAVTVSGLSPNTVYYYSVGTSTETLAGGDATFFFRTHPFAGTSVPTRVWVLGDSGTANASAQAVRNAYASFTGTRATDVWLMLGDNAYETGTDAEYQAAVFDMYPTFLKQAFLWPTLGNHDTAGSSNPPASLPYYQIFNLPVNGASGGIPSGTEDYYSFDRGNIHFVCLDSMTSSRSSTGPMATWLANDLAATSQDWLIAYWHHPPYSKGSHNSDTETQLVEMRANILPILEDHGVDLVLTGHSHSYERSFLLDGHYGTSGTLTSSMIKDGGSGRPSGTGAYSKPTEGLEGHEGAVYAVAGSSGKVSGGTLNHPAMFISLNNLGSMVLDVDGNRLDAVFLRETGAIADSFTIVKGTAPPPTATPTRTPTLVPPTATPTRTPTPVPPTAPPTSTPVPPTATPTRTQTPVPPTATATWTPVPPTATPTRTPTPATPTVTATSTPVPPTATPTRTPTPVPPTATPTSTPMPPTATPTPTPTPVPPTATSTPVPPTATPTPLAPATPTSRWYLHNRPSPPTGNTSSQANLPLNQTAPTASTLFNYDTDRDGHPGRLIQKGSSGAGEVNLAKYQNWLSDPLAFPLTTGGTVNVIFYSAIKNFGQNKAGSVTVFLRDVNGSTATEICGGTLTLSNWQGGSSTWVARTLSLNCGSYTIPAGHRLEVKLVVASAAADDMWFAYDTASYPSEVRLP